MHYYLSHEHLVSGALRGLVRMLWFALTFVEMAFLVLGARALIPTRLYRRIGPALRRYAGRRICRACGVRVRTSGVLPSDATLVVSNHLSWLDAFVYLGEIGPRFVAKSDWGEIAGLAAALRAGGVVFIRRTRLRDIHEVGERLRRFSANHELAMIFPEAGTTRGDALLPFRPGLLEPAASAGLTVGWAALRYETPPGWPPASVVAAWWDWTPLLLHMYRAFHPPWIRARIVYGQELVRGATRKELAVSLRKLVDGAFVPLEQMSEEDLRRIAVPPPPDVERY